MGTKTGVVMTQSKGGHRHRGKDDTVRGWYKHRGCGDSQTAGTHTWVMMTESEGSMNINTYRNSTRIITTQLEESL